MLLLLADEPCTSTTLPLTASPAAGQVRKASLTPSRAVKLLRFGRSEKSTFLKGSPMLTIGGGATPGPPSATTSKRAAKRTATTTGMVIRSRFINGPNETQDQRPRELEMMFA